MKLREFITEAAGPKVGRKYQHIEDLVLSDGSHGALHAVERLKHMGEEGGNIELKWDGMPVVYWGRDEQGNFGMFPKNAWQYLKSGKTETSSGASTVMRSPNDVKAFVMGTGGGDPKARQQFANQFASLWPYFEQISPKQGYLEGGLLFYPGTKPDGNSAMPAINQETNTYDFTPNITTFHIPVDSELGKKISKSKVMVAATGYFPTMGSSDEQRLPNAESLSAPGVIVQGTTYVQEPVPLDTQGLANLEAYLTKNAKLIDGYLAPKPGLSNPGAELYSYLNKHLRTQGLLADFPEWAKSNLSEKKAQTMLADVEGLKATLGAVEGISNQKNLLINQLSQGLHGGIKQTKPEGYVQAHPGKQFNYDMPGQFIKTIDQTNWAPKESVVNEAKGGKKAVVGWGRGMGHTGHDTLVKAVTHRAEATGATPYFFVSRSFGKEDPIPPETKLAMYQKKFPEYAKMFSLPPEGMTTLNQVLADLATKGITDVTLVVGETEKDAFGYLTRPDKSGNPPYKNFGLNSLTVMSRQDTKAPGSDKDSPDYHEGPRATPMREILLDPDKTEQEQFAVWRQAMSPSLDDQEVLDMMNTAKQNLVKFHTPKPRRKASKIKEQIAKMRPLLKEASVEQQYRMLKLLKEFSAVPPYAAYPTFDAFIEDAEGVEEGKKRKKKKTSRSLGRYFFPGYGYYGSGESGESGGDSGGDGGGGEGVAEGYTPSAGELARDLIKLPDPDFSKKYGMSKKQANQYYSSSKLKEQGVAEGSEIKIPTEDGITMQDIRLMTGDGPLTKKTILQAIAVIRKQRRPQGVSEKMKMGATIEPMEDKEKIDPVKTVIQFYEPIVNDIHKEKIDDYVDKARELLHKTDDPSIRTKLIDIFKKGKDNPYIQGGIITTVGALLAGGLLSSANKMGLSPSQTNILLQSVLNTVIPTIVSRINGKSWADTIKYTLASAGIGTSIAALTEKESDVIGHMAKDLSSDGAPVAKLRVARDREQMKKRERSDGLPVAPKFDDYLDEK